MLSDHDLLSWGAASKGGREMVNIAILAGGVCAPGVAVSRPRLRPDSPDAGTREPRPYRRVAPTGAPGARSYELRTD
jgi:hypothetical protein